VLNPQLDEDEGPGLVTINRHLHLIADANQEATLNVTFSLSSLIAGVDVDKFYTYKGGYTSRKHFIFFRFKIRFSFKCVKYYH